MVDVGANGSEATWSACGVPVIGEKAGGGKDEGRCVDEDCGKKSTSGSRDTTAPDLHGQEAGNSGGMDGPTAHIQYMHEGYGL